MSRWYPVPLAVRFPSVTSIIDGCDKGDGLLRWVGRLGYERSREEFKAAGELGTEVHQCIVNILSGLDVQDEDVSKKARPRLVAARKAISELGIGAADEQYKEVTVFSLTHGYAGTLDLVYRHNARRILLDWKTSNAIRDEYAMQLAAYREAWEERHPDQPIDECVIVRLDKNGSYDCREFKRNALDLRGFLGLLEYFRWKHRKEYEVTT